MKRIICILGLSFLFVQCMGEKKERVKNTPIEQEGTIKLYQSTEVPFQLNGNYVLKNKGHVVGVQHVKITSKAHFDRLFDRNTKQEESQEVDFSKSFVLALVGLPSTLETSFKIVSIKEKGDVIELIYCLEEEEKELAQAVYPYAVLVVDKKFNKDIRFLIE
ncbi:hypothetical protein [Myroides fluvii]|uniref:hypothetical protein n=1 Tax=Myroides fluvii TaxID=2572594 RepID=UPI00131E4D62|nr:hypothetical protein [Myroides fluvii]